MAWHDILIQVSFIERDQAGLDYMDYMDYLHLSDQSSRALHLQSPSIAIVIAIFISISIDITSPAPSSSRSSSTPRPGPSQTSVAVKTLDFSSKTDTDTNAYHGATRLPGDMHSNPPARHELIFLSCFEATAGLEPGCLSPLCESIPCNPMYPSPFLIPIHLHFPWGRNKRYSGTAP